MRFVAAARARWPPKPARNSNQNHQAPSHQDGGYQPPRGAHRCFAAAQPQARQGRIDPAGGRERAARARGPRRAANATSLRVNGNSRSLQFSTRTLPPTRGVLVQLRSSCFSCSDSCLVPPSYRCFRDELPAPSCRYRGSKVPRSRGPRQRYDARGAPPRWCVAVALRRCL